MAEPPFRRTVIPLTIVRFPDVDQPAQLTLENKTKSIVALGPR